MSGLKVERRQPIGGGERVDGQEIFRRAVEARRVIGAGVRGKISRHRPRRRRRRDEAAEAVEHAARRQRFVRGRRLGLVGVGDLRRTGERDDALEHIDEGAGKRQVGPARVAGDVEQHDQALAAPCRGDERSAVGERRPGVLAERRIRLGQHLPADGHVIGHGHAVERTLAGKRGEWLRLVPAQTAAERAPTAPQLDRNKIVVGGGKARAGEPYEHAAILDPARQAIMRLAGDIADIGED